MLDSRQKDNNVASKQLVPLYDFELNQKWTIDLNMRNRTELPSPPGFPEHPVPQASIVKQNQDTLVTKRSWDIALGPMRQIPMNIFIMWMAGNSISIFPIMMVIMTFLRPLQTLFAFSTTFQMIEGKQATLQKLVFILGNLLNIGLAVYKCHTMGLLPTYESDWLSFIDPPMATFGVHDVVDIDKYLVQHLNVQHEGFRTLHSSPDFIQNVVFPLLAALSDIFVELKDPDYDYEAPQVGQKFLSDNILQVWKVTSLESWLLASCCSCEKLVLDILKAHLKSRLRTLKQEESSVEVSESVPVLAAATVLQHTRYPHLSEHSDLFLPLILNLAATADEESQCLSLRCTCHFIQHSLKADLRDKNSGQLLLQHLDRWTHSTHWRIQSGAYKNILHVARAFSDAVPLLSGATSPAPVLDLELQGMLDDVVDRLLCHLYVESRHEHKTALSKLLPHYCQFLGVAMAKHWAAFLRCFRGVLQAPGSGLVKMRLAQCCLQLLHTCPFLCPFVRSSVEEALHGWEQADFAAEENKGPLAATLADVRVALSVVNK